jgi:hypothetical protein
MHADQAAPNLAGDRLLLCRRRAPRRPSPSFGSPGRDLNSEFEDSGEVLITRGFVLTSLVSDLSKVWFCAKRIQPRGGIELLPTGVVIPGLLLDRDVRWAAPYREQDSPWLDMKGAFVGKSGLYQPKDPICRAKRLQATGEA